MGVMVNAGLAERILKTYNRNKHLGNQLCLPRVTLNILLLLKNLWPLDSRSNNNNNNNNNNFENVSFGRERKPGVPGEKPLGSE